MQREQVAELQHGRQPFDGFSAGAVPAQQALFAFLLSGEKLPPFRTLVRLRLQPCQAETAKRLEMPGDDQSRQRTDPLGLANRAAPGAEEETDREASPPKKE